MIWEVTCQNQTISVLDAEFHDILFMFVGHTNPELNLSEQGLVIYFCK